MSFDLSGYDDVASRIDKFFAEHPVPEGRILTRILSDLGALEECVIQAEVWIGETLIATGHASEKRGQGTVNRTSHLENCETSAIGRALANMNYKTRPLAPRPSRQEMQKASAPLPAPPVSPLAERRLAVYGAFKDVGDNAEWRRGKLAQILGYSVVHAGKAFEEMTEAELGKVETWIETGALPEREGEEPPAEPAGMERPQAASISHSEETRTRETIAR